MYDQQGKRRIAVFLFAVTNTFVIFLRVERGRGVREKKASAEERVCPKWRLDPRQSGSTRPGMSPGSSRVHHDEGLTKAEKATLETTSTNLGKDKTYTDASADKTSLPFCRSER